MQLKGIHGAFVSAMLTASFAFASLHASAQQHPLLLDTSEVRVMVRDMGGSPVRDARIVMRVMKHGNDQGEMEVRTDANGSVEQDIIPIGNTVRLQILAPGFQAYSIDYPVNSLVKNLVVRLKPEPLIVHAAATEQRADVAKSTSPASVYREPEWVNKSAHKSSSKTHAKSVQGAASRADAADSYASNELAVVDQKQRH